MKKADAKGNFTKGIAFQALLYFVLAISFLVSGCCAMLTLWLSAVGAYSGGYEDYLWSRWDRVINEQYAWIVYSSDTLAGIEANCVEASRGSNATFEIIRESDKVRIWSNRNQKEQEDSYLVSGLLFRQGEYCLNVYVDTSFPQSDDLKYNFQRLRQLYAMRYVSIAGTAGGILLWLIGFVWLLCNAGRRRGQEGIAPGVLTDVYLDVLTLFWGIVSAGLVWVFILLWEWSRNDAYQMIVLLIWADVESLWWTAWLREFALRLKLGKWWRHSLIYVTGRALGRCMKKLLEFTGKFFQGLPTVPLAAAAVALVIVGEFVGIQYCGRNRPVLLELWFLEKLLLSPLALYCAMAFQRLLRASRALAEGDLSQGVSTRYLAGAFRKHGDNLNRINKGMGRAVEQRLQSERLKTELITNVSHDLKTPLTSVINYADLLGSAAADMPGTAEGDGAERIGQIREYSEALLRQSNRLKKLLDDLVEVSKASTGNLEVSLQPCELGVMLTQAAGEYEEKFGEKKLELRVAKPEEEIRILADGRHLWRIFDNLMNNICKYAQEGSRVYLNMEKKGGRVEIIFRNMSKYELNVPPQELTERFVRGDSSRHMEGSGLGLSIAGSLVELQKGEMEVLTDGDLFKVILRFPVLKDENA